MTEQEAYQEHIRYTHDTYCRIVIRHASFDAARMLAARWKREISLEYLTEEKFVPLSTTDEYFQVSDYGEAYLFSAQGQTILLDSRSLAAALARLLEQTQEGKNEVFYDCTLCKQILLLLFFCWQGGLARITARPIRHNAQVPDRNGKIFYTSIASLSHISKAPLIVVIVSAHSSDFFNSNLPVFSALFINHKVNMKFQTVLCCRKWFFPVHQGSDTASNQFLLPLHCLF